LIDSKCDVSPFTRWGNPVPYWYFNPRFPRAD